MLSSLGVPQVTMVDSCAASCIRDIVLWVFHDGVENTSSHLMNIAGSTQSLDFVLCLSKYTLERQTSVGSAHSVISLDILMQDHLDCQTMPVDAQP
jgi:hypothetical protein